MACTDAASRLVLGGSLTTPTSEETHRALAQALEGCDSLTLDCSEATEIDVSLLQTLVAARCSAERSHKTIGLASPPRGVLLDALRRCGFAAPPDATSLGDILTPEAEAKL